MLIKTIIQRIILLPIAFFAFSFLYLPFGNWHNQQRIFEILLIISCALGIIFVKEKITLTRPSIVLILIFFLFGLASVNYSQYKLASLLEWSRALGLVIVFFYIKIKSTTPIIKETILLILILSSILQALQFIFFYILSFITESYQFSPHLLMSGFDNIRSLSQFQVLAIPLMYYALSNNLKPLHKITIYLALCLNWTILINASSRAAFLSLGLSFIFVLYKNRSFKISLLHIILPLLFGIFLYFILFLILGPKDIGAIDIIKRGLSSRDMLWQNALQIFYDSPWLGNGPLSFTFEKNKVGAHPHQIILLLLSEWGSFATLSALLLFSMFIKNNIQNTKENLNFYLLIGILSYSITALFDGAYIMPYSEGWAVILFSLFNHKTNGEWRLNITKPIKLLALPFIILLFILLYFIPPPYSKEAKLQIEEYQLPSSPRFWLYHLID